MWIYSHGMSTKPRGWIQVSFVTIWMPIHPLPQKNNLFSAHLESILMLSKTRWWSISRRGLSKRFFYLEWQANAMIVRKKKGKMASVRRFHGFKQGSSERSLSYASDRLAGRCYCRPSSDKLFRCLSRIPLNTASIRRPRKDSFCYSHWKLPLQGNVIRLEKCRVHLSKDDN